VQPIDPVVVLGLASLFTVATGAHQEVFALWSRRNVMHMGFPTGWYRP